MNRFFSILVILFFTARPAWAVETEFHYHLTDSKGIKEVYLVWGVNDWQRYRKKLPNTMKAGSVMRTIMEKRGDEYVATLDIDPGNVIDYGFMAVKEAGPFNANIEYWDMDDAEGAKRYFTKAEDAAVIKVNGDIKTMKPKGGISLNGYGKFILIISALLAIVFFTVRRYYLKRPAKPFDAAGYFVAITGAMLLSLFFIRAEVADLMLTFLLAPGDTMLKMFGAAWDDILYQCILVLFFGALFLLLKRFRRTVLVTYTIFAFLSVVAALANIRIMSLLGRPFNYQWLYYSGFLKSRDASLAVAANVNWQFISGCLLMLCSAVSIAWLLYQLYCRNRLSVILLLPVFLIVSFFVKNNSITPTLKAANPVLFFVQSMASNDAGAMIDKSFAGKSDFDVKYTDSLPANYKQLFSRHKIKNVVFVVLESTPWEYVAPYSKNVKATPFLDEYAHKAVFENIYAHIPATNKSMFSFLCGAYPEISFKSLTLENPDVPLPSVPSELKKYGYRSVFFNSGDNGYQNAGGFLKARNFDAVEDFHENPCSNAVFSDRRYSKNKLDGVDDSCLSVRLFNWIGKDTSQPFFAMMWTFQTHYPYFVSGAEKDYNTGNPSLEKYLNGLRRADETIKAVVEGLQQRGLLESTLIVISGDHGEAFGRHDQTTHASAAFEENLHVPCILINPLLFNNERLPVTGGISDIAPTIFTILNKPAPGAWQGEDLFSINHRKRVYFFNPYSDYLFGVKEGNMKLIYNATDNTARLFDLAKDPHETNNIADSNPGFVKEYRDKIYAWMYYHNNYMQKAFGTKVPSK